MWDDAASKKERGHAHAAKHLSVVVVSLLLAGPALVATGSASADPRGT
jgi:hypothetical protein